MSGKMYVDHKEYLRFKDSNRLVHRWAAEKKLGRRIRRGCVVHHKDGKKRNNDPSNLEEKRRSAHSRLHARKRVQGSG